MHGIRKSFPLSDKWMMVATSATGPKQPQFYSSARFAVEIATLRCFVLEVEPSPSVPSRVRATMSVSDAIFRPFEKLIEPLEIPYRPLPAGGPGAVLLHFISMFRGVLIALALSAMAMEAINLSIVWD